jgi:glycosyltransferase involved in cell wall biosynthesis
LLSIIVPAYAQIKALSTTLGSLSEQSANCSDFEIIVVDDASPGQVDPVIEQWSPSLPLRLERHAVNLGRAAARNTGARASKGDRLLFLDADSVAHPQLVQRHLAAHQVEREVALLGRRVEPNWSTTSELSRPSSLPSTVSLDQEDPRFNDVAEAEILMKDVPWIFAHSHNVSYPRSAFEAVGGFDEEFKTWGWEDTELAYRLYRHWARRPEAFLYDPDAVCYHFPHYADVQRRWAASLPSGLDYFKAKYEHFDVERSGMWLRPFALSQGNYAAFMNRPETSVTSAVQALAAMLPTSARRLWGGRGSGDLPTPPLASMDTTQPASKSNKHLMGLSTPWPDGAFDDVVHWDNWRIVTIADLSECIAEGLRLAPVVYLAGTRDLKTDLPIAGLDNVRAALETAASLHVTQLPESGPIWVIEIRNAT